jgi:hypothetical protein
MNGRHEVYFTGHKEPEHAKEAWTVRFPDGKSRQFAQLVCDHATLISAFRPGMHPAGVLLFNGLSVESEGKIMLLGGQIE